MADSVAGAIRHNASHGGGGGNPFSDLVPDGAQICEVLIRHGEYVDGIRISWMAPDGTRIDGRYHGGSGGSGDIFTLEAGETITAISGASGDLVDSLYFWTSLERVYGPYGGDGGQPFSELFGPQPEYIGISGPPQTLIGIYGRSGDLLDALGVIVRVSEAS
jgi:hypothetical protein